MQNFRFINLGILKVVGPLVLSLSLVLLSSCSYPTRMGYDRELGNWPSAGKRVYRAKGAEQKIKIYKSGKGTGLDKIVKPWLGTPYLWGGNQKQIGTDCSGYVQSVMKEWSGMLLPRTSGQMYASGKNVDKEDLKPGDLVFFGPGWSVNHVGIYTGNNFFTHSSSSNGVEYRSLSSSYWDGRYQGAKRYE